MHYGEIKNCDIANGIGVRVTLFVSGCENRCKNCFQPETWNFEYGKPFTKETEEYIFTLLSAPYIKGLTVLGGEPFEPSNQRALYPFLKEVKSRFDFMKAQIDDVEESKKKLLKLIDELTGTMQQLFIERFNLINENFSHTFVELFGGGLAQLTLSDPIDVLNSGIEINVQPLGKKVSSIEQLSGGEKSLVAIAIYFAMMKVAPPPFCMLDEVESALDDINVDRFANYLRKMSDKTQFVIVTHRRGSMEEADVLYGVTMQEKGVSKLLQLNLSQVEDIIK